MKIDVEYMWILLKREKFSSVRSSVGGEGVEGVSVILAGCVFHIINNKKLWFKINVTINQFKE